MGMRAIMTEKQDKELGASRPMHVISENQEDMTSSLALPPTHLVRARSKEHLGVDKCPSADFLCAGGADFVNTQAINARVLAQSLAYPDISACMQDLISDTGRCNA